MRLRFVILAVAAFTLGGCTSLSTPTTQPTSAGVLSVTAMWQAYDATVQTEISAYNSGLISKSTLAADAAVNKQAYNDILAAQNAALAGDSAAQGLLSTATAALQNAENAGNTSTTQP